MSQQTDGNREEVKLLMKFTFYTQREQVNQGKNIQFLLEEWPFWFSPLGMALHFMELTGIGLKETFARNLDLKGERLLNYMNTVCLNKNKKFLQAVTKSKVMRGELNGCSEDVKEMLLLLLAYFDEKQDSMLCHVEDTCLAEEVPMDQVPLTPTIVVVGKFTIFILFKFCIYLFFLPFLSLYFLPIELFISPQPAHALFSIFMLSN